MRTYDLIAWRLLGLVSCFLSFDLAFPSRVRQFFQLVFVDKFL